MAYDDIRKYFEVLEGKGKLRRVRKSVDRTWELACLARWAYQGLPDQERFGILFERVEGFDIPVVTGAVGASRDTCAIALETEPDRLNQKLMEGLLSPVPTKAVESARCQEVVCLGEQVDLNSIPIPVWTPGKVRLLSRSSSKLKGLFHSRNTLGAASSMRKEERTMSEDQNREQGYKVKFERDVYIKMRDGVALAADIFRPDAEGKFPALLSLSPYGKGLQSLDIPPQPAAEAPLYSPAIEAGDPRFFVSRGYVHVIVDLRGTGKSEGEYRGWMSKQEAENGYDLVEWIAQQPWSDGNVGMVGISYYGTIQLSVAAEQPPHLKAIMPFNAPADFYRESTYHGGMLQTFFHFLYGVHIPANYVCVTAQEKSPEEFNRLLRETEMNPDIRMYPTVLDVVQNPRRTPAFLDILLNPTDGPYYWERSAYTKYDKIKIPFYASSGWWAYAHMHLRGAFQNFLEIDAPKKLLINRPVCLDCPLPKEYNEEVVRWYDYWLKGIDTGIMGEPPIKIFVMGENKFRFENEWPLARTKWTKYYLHHWGKLLPEPEEVPGRPDCFVQQPPEETATIQSVKYLTPPLTNDMEVTGPIAFYLYAEINQDDTNWIVALRDVAADNTESEMTRGFLKASHRALDKTKSKPWQPYHPHTKPQPVEHGKIYEYAIELTPTSYVFKAGHRIKLEITCMDHPRAPVAPPGIGQYHLPYHICSSKPTLHKIYHDREYPSHLVLPVIPRTTA